MPNVAQKRVLIADDEPIELTYLHSVLAQAPLNLSVLEPAANGQQLVDLYRRHRPDVVIADICMPVMSGLDALRQIRAENRDVVLLINTAFADFSYALAAIEIGVEAFLLKPSAKADVIGAVRHALARRTAAGPDADMAPITPLIDFYRAITEHDLHRLVPLTEAARDWFTAQSNVTLKRFAFLNFRLTTVQMMRLDPLFRDDTAILENQLELDMLTSDVSGSDFQHVFDSYFTRLTYILMHKMEQCDDLGGRLDRYLSEHFRTPLTLTDLASHFFLTGAHLSSCYRKKTGYSIAEKLRRLRLEESIRLLIGTEIPIKEIASKVGYTQSSYFHKVFKEHHGCSPTDYRRRHRP